MAVYTKLRGAGMVGNSTHFDLDFKIRSVRGNSEMPEGISVLGIGSADPVQLEKLLTVFFREASKISGVALPLDLTFVENIVEGGGGGGGGGGTSVHGLLSGRSNADQHPTSAISGLDTKLNAASTGLATEAASRGSADTALDTKINNEMASRASGDTALGGRITSEQTARGTADETLQDNIDALAGRLTNYVQRAGDVMTGALMLAGAPTQDLQAATKKYADDLAAALTSALNTYLRLAGGTMTGALTLNANPTAPLHAATKQWVESVMGGIAVRGFAFRGFIASSAPTLDVREGNFWLNAALEAGVEPSKTFPWTVDLADAASAWTGTTNAYTPIAMDLWYDVDNQEAWFYVGSNWERLDFSAAAFDPTYFQAIAGGMLSLVPGSIGNAQIAANAAIDQSKIAGLTSDLAEKAELATGATAGNVATVNADGSYGDGGKQVSSLLQQVASPVADDVVTLNADGTVKDSGKAISTFKQFYAGSLVAAGADFGVTIHQAASAKAAQYVDLSGSISVATDTTNLPPGITKTADSAVYFHYEMTSSTVGAGLCWARNFGGWQGVWKWETQDGGATLVWTKLNDDIVVISADAVAANTSFFNLCKSLGKGFWLINDTPSLAAYTDTPWGTFNGFAYLDIKFSGGSAWAATLTLANGVIYSNVLQRDWTVFQFPWKRLDNDPNTMSDYPTSITAGTYTSVNDLVTALGSGFYYITAADFVNYTDRPNDFISTTGAFVRAVGFGNPTTPNGVTIELTINNVTNVKWTAYLTGVGPLVWDKVLTASTSLIGNVMGPPDRSATPVVIAPSSTSSITAVGISYIAPSDGYISGFLYKASGWGYGLGLSIAGKTVGFVYHTEGTGGTDGFYEVAIRKGQTAVLRAASPGPISGIAELTYTFVPALPAITGVPTVNNLVTMGPADTTQTATKANGTGAGTTSWTVDKDGWCQGLVTTTETGQGEVARNGVTQATWYGKTGVWSSGWFQVLKDDVITCSNPSGTVSSGNRRILWAPAVLSAPVYLQSAPVLDYSTTEQDTYVKWLDGKTIYQKTIHWQGGWTAASNNNVGNPTTLIPGATQIIDNLIIASVQGAKRMGRATLAEITATSILLMSSLSWGDSTTQNDITLWYTK